VRPTGNYLLPRQHSLHLRPRLHHSFEHAVQPARRFSRFEEPNVRLHEGFFDPKTLGFSRAPRALRRRFLRAALEIAGGDMGQTSATRSSRRLLRPAHMTRLRASTRSARLRLPHPPLQPARAGHVAACTASTPATRAGRWTLVGGGGRPAVRVVSWWDCPPAAASSARRRWPPEPLPWPLLPGRLEGHAAPDLNLGVRWDREPPSPRLRRGAAGFDPDAASPIAAAAQSSLPRSRCPRCSRPTSVCAAGFTFPQREPTDGLEGDRTTWPAAASDFAYQADPRPWSARVRTTRCRTCPRTSTSPALAGHQPRGQPDGGLTFR